MFLPSRASAAGVITSNTHQGQNSDGSWSPGNNTQYSEGDYVDYRFTLSSSGAPSSGQMYVKYEGSCHGGDQFFTNYFNIKSVTPSGLATVTTSGSPTVVSGDYRQALNLNFSSSGSVVVVYTLKISDDASDCNGSSSSVRLGETATPGDYSNTGVENIPAPAKVFKNPSIKITKNVASGSALPSQFSFTVSPAINGVSVFNIPAGQTSVTINKVNPDGIYTITESGPSGYLFTGGTGTNCKPDTTTLNTAGGKMTATVTAGENPVNAVCNFTNNAGASITIVKDAVPNSDQDFSFTATGTGVQNFVLDDFAASATPSSITFNSLLPGTFTFTETSVAGWDLASISCPNITETPITRGVSLTITAGQNITCTFRNEQRGKIIVNKVTDPANDPTSFPISISPSSGVNGQTNRSLSVSSPVEYDVAHGTYNVTEDLGNYPNWEQIGNNCNNLVIDGNTPLVNGVPTRSCTITNKDTTPGLKVVKNVVNDNGGTLKASAFTMLVNDVALTGGVLSNSDLTATYSYQNPSIGESYFVSETQKAEYSASVTTCTDDLTLLPVANPVVLEKDQDVTCVITNNDKAPKLTVVKDVSNQNGGTLEVSDFPLYVGDVLVVSGETNEFNAGTYSLSEDNQEGYTASGWSGENCSLDGTVVLEIGGVYTCTITNSDQPAKITVTKLVQNNNGGNATASDFTLKVNSTIVASGVQNTFNGNASYTVSEQFTNASQGYEQVSIVCNDITGQTPVVVGSTFTAQLGHSYSCLVTNKDVAPTLKVVKHIKNDNGGTAVVEDFDIKLEDMELSFGPPAINGSLTTHTAIPSVMSNAAYTLSEIDFAGYTEGNWVCTSDMREDFGGSFDDLSLPMLNEGENVLCSIVNDDQAGTLILKKTVNNGDGGTLGQADFPVFIGSNQVSWDNSNSVSAGSYKVSETTQEGYQPSAWGGNCDAEGNVVVGSGETKTCTITNDDIAPTITVIKSVVNDNGGTATKDDFVPYVGDQPLVWEESREIKAGKHSVSETMNVFGYAASSWSGNCDADGSFVAEVGHDYVCYVTNDDIAPKLKVVKQTYPNSDPQDFKFTLNVQKQNEDDEWENVIEDINFTLDTDSDDSAHSQSYVTGDDFSDGRVTITEEALTGWYQEPTISCMASATDHEPYYFSTTGVFNLSLGWSYECTVSNEKLATVNVTKFHDVDEDGYWDEDEEALPDWTINLDEECGEWMYRLKLSETSDEGCDDAYSESIVTNEDGVSEFENIRGGWYNLSEDLKDGWEQSDIYCDYQYELFDERSEAVNWSENWYDDSRSIYVDPGETLECYVGNHRTPKFNLTKTNDAPNPKLRGEVVTYTLTVTVPEADESGRVYDSNGNWYSYDERMRPEVAIAEPGYEPVTVVDLPPEDFNYVSGSWTAVSNLRGDLKTQGITTEPTYSSPGVWNLTNEESGFLTPGEIITLTYKAIIGSSVATASHPDSAFASGFDGNGDKIFANSSLSPFVGTKVSIIDPARSTGFVLGTSVTLVDTGDAVLLRILIGAGVILIVGLLFRTKKFATKKSGLLLIGLSTLGFVGMVLFSNGSASAASLATVQVPYTTTNTKSFNVGYTIQSTDQNEDFQVKLYINGVESAVQNTIKDFGDSGQFAVSLPSDGVYTFKTVATVTAGANVGEVAESSLVSTTIDTAVPVAPAYGGAIQTGNTYQITFNVPAGTDIAKVNVYASTSKNFSLNASTKIASITSTPGSVQSYTFNAPTNEKYYFAIDGVDSAGNTSSSVGDSEVVVQTAPSSSSDSSVVASSNSTTTGQVQGEASGVDPSKVNQPFEQAATEAKEEKDDSKTALIAVLGVAAAAVAFAVYRRIKSDNAEAELASTKASKNKSSRKK